MQRIGNVRRAIRVVFILSGLVVLPILAVISVIWSCNETPRDRGLAETQHNASAVRSERLENTLPLERLIAPPDGVRREIEHSGSITRPASRNAISKPEASGPEPSDSDPLKPLVAVGSERLESAIPTIGRQSTKIGAGVSVSPRDAGQLPPDVAISLEGGVRQDVYDEEPDLARRDTSVGVRIEIPLGNMPSERDG